jgi:ribonuclease P/MRP protein subunit RPP1
VCARACADAAARRNVIANALAVVRVTKGRNLLLSSGATKALELRGPYDAANL